MSEEAPFLELCRPAAFTLLEKRSRFLAELLPASSPEEAREGVAAQRSKYPDASHVVHAMVVGEKGEVMGCSDDGEPAGTAGRPVLEILKGSRVTQVLLTVTRWFGGIKLGTGGLVHAYGDAARGVLSEASTRPRIPCARCSLLLAYPQLEAGRRILREQEFTVLAEEYSGEGVLFQGTLPARNLPLLETLLRDLTRGRLRLSLLGPSP